MEYDPHLTQPCRLGFGEALTILAGWLHCVFVTGVLLFGVDGTICWARHNCPGSWNDSVARHRQVDGAPRYPAKDSLGELYTSVHVTLTFP